MTTEQRVSECLSCPEWIVRCAHFNDHQVLYLARRSLFGTHDCRWPKEYGVYVVELNETGSCRCGCGEVFALGDTRFFSLNTDDYDAALAAFFETEESLLRGES